ncbi:MAG: hypothetical protein AAB552_02625 [Patescibacteria group bacterium]
MDRKKILIIATVIILVLGGGIGAYYYFLKKPVTLPPSGNPFPGGGNLVTKPPLPPDNNPDDGVFPPSNASTSRLYELHKTPVAGVGFAEQVNGKKKTFFARSLERGLGHIFETNLETLVESRISGETYPGITEAFFGNNGKSVIIRSLSEQEGIAIKTRSLGLTAPTISFAPANSDTGEANIPPPTETNLPDYIPHLGVAEDGADKIFYMENSFSSARGSTSNFKGTAISTIFNSSFTEWLPQLPNQKLATLTTKPSSNVPGHLYFIDTQSSALTKILGDVKGLTTTTSRDGKFVLYTEVKAGVPNLIAYDVAKKESRPLSLNTLAEKCGWSTKDPVIAYCAIPENPPRGQYPDQWYQGVISFSDSMWKINAKTGFAEKIFTPEKYRGGIMDIINPIVSSDEAYLVFINKKTSTPWLFMLNEKPQIIVPSTQ